MLESESGKENGKYLAHLLLPSVTYNVLWDGIEQNFGVSTPFLWKVNFIYIRNFVFQTLPVDHLFLPFQNKNIQSLDDLDYFTLNHYS